MGLFPAKTFVAVLDVHLLFFEEKEKSMQKKRILVTGGAGFLGSHLCEKLLAMDCHVTCLDNFYTGSHDNLASFADVFQQNLACLLRLLLCRLNQALRQRGASVG